MTEQNLIQRVLSGDTSAEHELYNAYVDRVFRLAYRLAGESDLAQDFVQETFIKVFSRLNTFRGESALGTWITSIALSVALNGLRKVKRFRQREANLDEASMVTGGGGRRTEPDLKKRMREAIDRLPEGYRTVFVMHDMEGYTHEEIGTALGVQPGTSKAQLFRARAKLREALSEFAGETAI